MWYGVSSTNIHPNYLGRDVFTNRRHFTYFHSNLNASTFISFIPIQMQAYIFTFPFHCSRWSPGFPVPIQRAVFQIARWCGATKTPRESHDPRHPQQDWDHQRHTNPALPVPRWVSNWKKKTSAWLTKTSTQNNGVQLLIHILTSTAVS